MVIFDFDTKKGVYCFEFDDLNTETHSHPVVEVIMATEGTFVLESNKTHRAGLDFAIIDANTKHKVTSQDCTVKVLMVESHNTVLLDFFNKNNIVLNNGLFLNTTPAPKNELFITIKNLAQTKDLKTTTDERVNECMKLMKKHELEYKELIPVLTSKVFLSDSRLSHLFKAHIGVSIKKYLVWNKLRQAISFYLSENTNLTDASHQSGFFDQAHLTNAFKDLLGVSPSKAYNSRTLQFWKKGGL